MDRPVREIQMKQQTFQPSPFTFAIEDLMAALPTHLPTTDKDLTNIQLPGWRYDEIMESVLHMYETVNAQSMPLPVSDIAHGLGCSLIPYRTYGRQVHDALMSASQDALVIQFLGSKRPIIMYNDRMPVPRINFSIMHELGHIELGHMEHCPLAEKEAHYFAGVALCPVDLLEHHGITDPREIARIFNVSAPFANNRAQSLMNRKMAARSLTEQKFRDAVIERFRLKLSPQMDFLEKLAG